MSSVQRQIDTKHSSCLREREKKTSSLCFFRCSSSCLTISDVLISRKSASISEYSSRTFFRALASAVLTSSKWRTSMLCSSKSGQLPAFPPRLASLKCEYSHDLEQM